MNINEWVTKVHVTAMEHGWWPPDKERSVPEMIALMHSELSEATEQYRLGKPMVWAGENNKPEGVAVELADCVIRAFDYAGSVTEDFAAFIADNRADWPEDGCIDFYEMLVRAHEALSKALEVYRSGGDKSLILNGIAECCDWVFRWLGYHDICIDGVIAEKHAYNETRPYRHGGKKA